MRSHTCFLFLSICTFFLGAMKCMGQNQDTIFIQGKEVVFLWADESTFPPSIGPLFDVEKMQAFKTMAEGIQDSLGDKLKVSLSSASTLAVIRLRDTVFHTRDPQQGVASALYLFNDYYTFDNQSKTAMEYHHAIQKYFDNARYEIPIEIRFVTALNGLNIRTADGEIEGKYLHGESVNILGYLPDTVSITDGAKQVKGRWAIVQWRHVQGCCATTKKRYVFDAYLGEKNEVKIFPEQLTIGLEGKDLWMDSEYNYPEAMDHLFEIEILNDCQSLDGIKPLPMSESVKVKKNEDGSENFSLPLGNGDSLHYKSEVKYSSSAHFYQGDLEFLNAYCVYSLHYEAEEAYYALIDRTDGSNKFSVMGYPYFNPSHQRMITMYFDVYNDTFYLTLYRVNPDKSIALERNFVFSHWVGDSSKGIHWIDNDSFVVQAYPFNLWNGSPETPGQCLEVKLKF